MVRGDLEDAAGVCMDSPTFDLGAHNLLLSWASCEGVQLKAGDVSNADFQEPVDQLLLVGRRYCPRHFARRSFAHLLHSFRKKFWSDLVSTGLKENTVMRAVEY